MASDLQERLRNLTADQIMVLQRVAGGFKNDRICKVLYLKQGKLLRILAAAYAVLGIEPGIPEEQKRLQAGNLYLEYDYPFKVKREGRVVRPDTPDRAFMTREWRNKAPQKHELEKVGPA